MSCSKYDGEVGWPLSSFSYSFKGTSRRQVKESKRAVELEESKSELKPKGKEKEKEQERVSNIIGLEWW